MQKTALVIMAAGIGSRFGKGIKQLAPVGPCGEIIMDYSIHDALEAGFNKVVFIIRKDLEEEFRKVIGERIEKITEVEYIGLRKINPNKAVILSNIYFKIILRIKYSFLYKRLMIAFIAYPTKHIVE